nr:hypothetical protein [Tanacetum cinerariifolium]
MNALNKSIVFDNPVRGIGAIDGLDGTESGYQRLCHGEMFCLSKQKGALEKKSCHEEELSTARVKVSTARIDLSYSGLEEFQQPKFQSYRPKSCKTESKNASKEIPNELKESLDAPFVKNRVSNNKDCTVESSVVVEKKTIVPTVTKIEFVKAKQQEKPVRKPVKYAEMYRLTAITIKGKGWYLGIFIQRPRPVNTVRPRPVNTARRNLVVVNAVRTNKNPTIDKPQSSCAAKNKNDNGVNKDSGIDAHEKSANNINDVNTVGPSINTASTDFDTGSLNINNVSLTVSTASPEATHANFFGDQPEGDMSNINTTYQVPSTPNTRIHKDHSLDLIYLLVSYHK